MAQADQKGDPCVSRSSSSRSLSFSQPSAETFRCYPDCIEGPPTCGCPYRRIDELEELLRRSEGQTTATESKLRSLEEQLEAAREALRGFVGAIERADLIRIEPSYGPLEKALHEADRVLASFPAKRPT